MKQILLWVSILSFIFASCNRGGDTPGTTQPNIGFVMKTLNNPFFIQMNEGAQAAADDAGITLTVQAADREIDVDRQMQIIENLIITNVDALCITPSGSKEIIPAILKANQAGIPVLIVDTGLDVTAVSEMGAEFVTFIGSDNFQGGKIAGEYLAKTVTDNVEVAILEGVPGHETNDARLNGFKESIQNASHLMLVASQPANFERAQGFNVFQNILQTNPNVKALFASNDMMALGAVEAIDAAGKTGQITIIGFDAVDEARKAIEQGKMHASVAQNPSEMGRIAVMRALDVINGESIPTEIPVDIELITK